MKVSQQQPVPFSFTPVTITLTSPSELADVVGALTAYGKGKTKAKKSIREAGLASHYSGNARKTARTVVTAIAKQLNLPTPNFGTGVTASVNESAISEALRG
jgi:hypothetical protein